VAKPFLDKQTRPQDQERRIVGFVHLNADTVESFHHLLADVTARAGQRDSSSIASRRYRAVVPTHHKSTCVCGRGGSRQRGDCERQARERDGQRADAPGLPGRRRLPAQCRVTASVVARDCPPTRSAPARWVCPWIDCASRRARRTSLMTRPSASKRCRVSARTCSNVGPSPPEWRVTLAPMPDSAVPLHKTLGLRTSTGLSLVFDRPRDLGGSQTSVTIALAAEHLSQVAVLH